MRSLTLLACLGAPLMFGCAQAMPPAAAPALPPQAAAAAAAPRPGAIEDVEPDTTRQVKEVLGQLANGHLARERLTERASGELAAPAETAMGATLRSCNEPLALELLERKTKGEDRQYLYRARCNGGDLFVEIDFNKAARINKLVVRK